jgi:opacity protein-like surface antigen
MESNMKTTFSIAAIAAVLAAPAFAGGVAEPMVEPVIAPAPAPVLSYSDWTGPYAGVQLGYGDLDLSRPAGAAPALDAGGHGWLGGVHAGYMWDFGTWVLGGEVDYDAADIDLTSLEEIDPAATGSLDSVARLKLRAGYDAGQALIYGTAGPAWANATISDGATSSDFSDVGYFAGVGVAYQLTDRWILGGEVLSHQFDNFDNTGIDIDATTATVRASFRF